jgi:transcriptional regulator with XRE-family HTH domain
MRLTLRAQLRRRAGLTQHDLTKLTGISDTRISLWENSQIELPEGAVEKIAWAIQQEFERVPTRLTGPRIRRALRSEPTLADTDRSGRA